MIGAGDFRDSVGFYRRIDLSDTSPESEGGIVDGGYPDEATVGPVAAMIKPRLGGEGVLAGRLTGQNLVNITVRKSSDTAQITTDWKARNARSGEVFNVRSAIDPFQHTPQRGRFIELLCEKGAAI